MKNINREFLNIAKMSLVTFAACMATLYTVRSCDEKARKDQAKAEIEKLSQQNDSIENAKFHQIASLYAEKDIVLELALRSPDVSYQDYYDELQFKTDSIKKDADHQILFNNAKIKNLAKYHNIQLAR